MRNDYEQKSNKMTTTWGKQSNAGKRNRKAKCVVACASREKEKEIEFETAGLQDHPKRTRFRS